MFFRSMAIVRGPLALWRRHCAQRGASRRRALMPRSPRPARSRTHCRSIHAIQPTSRESRGLTSGQSTTLITSRADAIRLLGPCRKALSNRTICSGLLEIRHIRFRRIPPESTYNSSAPGKAEALIFIVETRHCERCPRRSRMRVFCLLQDHTGLPAVRRSRGLSVLCERSLMRNSNCLTKRRTLLLWLTRLPSGRTKTHRRRWRS